MSPPATLFTGAVGVATHVSIIGYGAPGTPSGGVGELDGTRLGGENGVDSIGDDIFGTGTNYVLADFGPLRAVPTPSLPLEFGLTGGGSGGGWYDDQGQLIALSCFEYAHNKYSGAIMVSSYNDWIDQTIGASVPEPATWVIFVSGAPFLFSVIRRQRNAA